MIVFTIGLLAFTQVGSAPVNELLPAPELGRLVLFDPAGIIINWKPIVVIQDVHGYKVKLWEAQGMKTYKYKTVNGTRVLVERFEKPALSLFCSSNCKVYEYMLSGRQQSRLVLNDVQLDTPYYFEVLAFNAEGDGIPSSKIGVQLQASSNESEES